ncbi:MAG: single-stranded-DNA-specific exonuclease RecJ [bacterium]
MPAILPARRWNLPGPPPPEADGLARALGLPLTAARLLCARGFVEPGMAAAFLDPTSAQLHRPDSLPDIVAATGRVIAAVEQGETICVHGDYDVDGISATVLLVTCLERIGGRVQYYLPHREAEGYGLAANAVAYCRELGATLLITVDCGSTDHEVVRAARAAGIDVVITDHHEVPPELPEALAVVNPKRPDSAYPFRELAGVGVAFKLAWSVLSALGRERAELSDLLDLVGLGTIADVVPLLDENRVLARLGLIALREARRPGIRALLDRAGIAGRPLTDYDVGFVLAPRLNAAGRVDHARTGARLLLTDDPAEAARFADRLEDNNRERRRLEKVVLDAAITRVEADGVDGRRVLVAAGDGWPAGVLGLVASRLAERYYRPAFVIGLHDGRGRGSGRSIPGFDLYSALAACADCLAGFGGHRQAGGLSLAADCVSEFSKAVNAWAAGLADELFIPGLDIDALVPPDELGPEFLEFIRRLEPFGAGNRQPLFAGIGLEVVGLPRRVGNDHLKFQVRSGGRTVPAIAWGRSADLPGLEPGRPASLDICFSIDRRPTPGYEAGIIVRDLRTHDPAAGQVG